MTNHISIRTTTREGEEISILGPPKMSPCHRVASLVVVLAWWLEIIVIWPGSDKSRCVRCCGGGNVASFTDCKWMLFRSDTLLPHKAQTFKLKPLPPTSIHYLFATDIPKHTSMVCHDPTVQNSTPPPTHTFRYAPLNPAAKDDDEDYTRCCSSHPHQCSSAQRNVLLKIGCSVYVSDVTRT